MAKLNVAAKGGNLDQLKAAFGEAAKPAKPATTTISKE